MPSPVFAVAVSSVCAENPEALETDAWLGTGGGLDPPDSVSIPSQACPRRPHSEAVRGRRLGGSAAGGPPGAAAARGAAGWRHRGAGGRGGARACVWPPP